ncbi:MAG: response regulator [Thermodesulfovibrionales bacterium]
MVKKILIVEDDELNRKLFQSILHEAGYDVLAAADGDEAIEIMRKESPNLILLDIIMPGKSGLDVLKTLKEEGLLRGSKVYALTATYLSEQDALNFDGIITKPIRIIGFKETVRKAIGG